MEFLLTNEYFLIILFLFCAALIAGLVDAIAGGGGLITVPCLLLAGIPPLTALGTNRMQSSMGELTAFLTFWKKNQFFTPCLTIGIVFTAIGAVIGSYAVNLFSADLLELLLPILMLLITIYSIFSRRLKSSAESQPKMSLRTFMIGFGSILGFYNGFFGPGTGTLWMIAFVVLAGLTIKNASINTKPLNLVSNLISLVFFIGVGQIDFTIGIVMGTGQIVGASIGSRIVISNGDKVVRPVFITVTLVMTSMLIYQAVTKGGYL